MITYANYRRGFTITETIVAIALSAMVLVASYPLLTSTTRKLYQARDHYTAATLCMAAIERGREIPYDQVATLLGKDDKVRIDITGANSAEGRFRRTTTVAFNSPDPGVTTFTVTVEILDRSTGTFKGEKETISYIFTAYLQPTE
jgi:prepilin-type N-terminal cleavage/methylation domain-containing protein